MRRHKKPIKTDKWLDKTYPLGGSEAPKGRQHLFPWRGRSLAIGFFEGVLGFFKAILGFIVKWTIYRNLRVILVFYLLNKTYKTYKTYKFENHTIGAILSLENLSIERELEKI